jgi:hypothetical protein
LAYASSRSSPLRINSEAAATPTSIGRSGSRPPAERRAWTLALAVAQLEAASFRVVDSDEVETVTRFADVGALAWFLKAAPWVVPGFSLRDHRAALGDFHRRIVAEGPYPLRELGFWLEAVRDPAR